MSIMDEGTPLCRIFSGCFAQQLAYDLHRAEGVRADALMTSFLPESLPIRLAHGKINRGIPGTCSNITRLALNMVDFEGGEFHLPHHPPCAKDGP